MARCGDHRGFGTCSSPSLLSFGATSGCRSVARGAGVDSDPFLRCTSPQARANIAAFSRGSGGRMSAGHQAGCCTGQGRRPAVPRHRPGFQRRLGVVADQVEVERAAQQHCWRRVEPDRASPCRGSRTGWRRADARSSPRGSAAGGSPSETYKQAPDTASPEADGGAAIDQQRPSLRGTGAAVRTDPLGELRRSGRKHSWSVSPEGRRSVASAPPPQSSA